MSRTHRVKSDQGTVTRIRFISAVLDAPSAKLDGQHVPDTIDYRMLMLLGGAPQRVRILREQYEVWFGKSLCNNTACIITQRLAQRGWAQAEVRPRAGTHGWREKFVAITPEGRYVQRAVIEEIRRRIAGLSTSPRRLKHLRSNPTGKGGHRRRLVVA